MRLPISWILHPSMFTMFCWKYYLGPSQESTLLRFFYRQKCIYCIAITEGSIRAWKSLSYSKCGLLHLLVGSVNCDPHILLVHSRFHSASSSIAVGRDITLEFLFAFLASFNQEHTYHALLGNAISDLLILKVYFSCSLSFGGLLWLCQLLLLFIGYQLFSF